MARGVLLARLSRLEEQVAYLQAAAEQVAFQQEVQGQTEEQPLAESELGLLMQFVHCMKGATEEDVRLANPELYRNVEQLLLNEKELEERHPKTSFTRPRLVARR